MSSTILVVLLSIQLLCCELAYASYVFEVRVESYSNPNSLDIDGSDCDDEAIGTDPCDNIFTFCLRASGSPQTTDTDSCPLGGPLETMVFTDSDSIGFGASVVSLGNSISNPLSFTGGSWPGGFLLYVYVEDFDQLTSNDPVDNIFIDKALATSSSFTTGTFVGDNGNGRIELSFRVQCSEGFTGEDCTDTLSTTTTPTATSTTTSTTTPTTIPTTVFTTVSTTTTATPLQIANLLGPIIGGGVGGLVGVVLIIAFIVVVIIVAFKCKISNHDQVPPKTHRGSQDIHMDNGRKVSNFSQEDQYTPKNPIYGQQISNFEGYNQPPYMRNNDAYNPPRHAEISMKQAAIPMRNNDAYSCSQPSTEDYEYVYDEIPSRK